MCFRSANRQSGPFNNPPADSKFHRLFFTADNLFTRPMRFPRRTRSGARRMWTTRSELSHEVYRAGARETRRRNFDNCALLLGVRFCLAQKWKTAGSNLLGKSDGSLFLSFSDTFAKVTDADRKRSATINKNRMHAFRTDPSAHYLRAERLK